jgi:hypothetical protein
MRKQRDAEVFRITGARQGLAEDVRGRQRRYVISMLVRTVAVLLTVVLWNVVLPLAVVTLVLGLVLPYVAVVIANAGRESAPSAPETFVPAPERRALEGAETERDVREPVAEAGDGHPDGPPADRS